MMDILPIILVFAFFQWGVIRKGLPHWKKMLTGMGMVVFGLAVFIVGLEECIFPLGTSMAQQLSDPQFLMGDSPTLNSLTRRTDRCGILSRSDFIWISDRIFDHFGGAGFNRRRVKSQRNFHRGHFHIGPPDSGCVGVGVGVALGVFRIIEGIPLHYYIITGYVILMIQTYFAPKFIVPLAYDSGGVTTSTVTVPLLVALGLGLASNVPGSSPLLDGFGLIAFASLFPMISVLAYAMIQERFFSRVPDSAMK